MRKLIRRWYCWCLSHLGIEYLLDNGDLFWVGGIAGVDDGCVVFAGDFADLGNGRMEVVVGDIGRNLKGGLTFIFAQVVEIIQNIFLFQRDPRRFFRA